MENRYIQVRGRVVEIVEDRGYEHIDRLSIKYRKRHWKPVEGEIRVIYKILPESVFLDD